MLQNYAFSAKPPRKMPKICKLSANYPKINCKLLTINSKLPSPCGPSPHNLAQTFDGPPTLERSGAERREGAVTSSRP